MRTSIDFFLLFYFPSAFTIISHNVVRYFVVLTHNPYKDYEAGHAIDTLQSSIGKQLDF